MISQVEPAMETARKEVIKKIGEIKKNASALLLECENANASITTSINGYPGVSANEI